MAILIILLLLCSCSTARNIAPVTLSDGSTVEAVQIKSRSIFAGGTITSQYVFRKGVDGQEVLIGHDSNSDTKSLFRFLRGTPMP